MSFRTDKRRASRVDFSNDPGLTEQSHKAACDIHNIMRKAQKTGLVDHVNEYKGSYMAMPNSVDFHEHMNIIAQANEMFESVPAEIRKKFGNDPGAFVDFMQDAANYERIQEMGLDPSHLPTPAHLQDGYVPPPEPTPPAE